MRRMFGLWSIDDVRVEIFAVVSGTLRHGRTKYGKVVIMLCEEITPAVFGMRLLQH